MRVNHRASTTKCNKMKDKLLKRIRENWFIGISESGTYILVQKKGLDAGEFCVSREFYIHILKLYGLCSDISWFIAYRHFSKLRKRKYHRNRQRMRQSLLDKISR